MEMLGAYRQLLHHVQPVGVTGRVSAVLGLSVSVSDFPAPIGGCCRILRDHRSIEARVVGFAGGHTVVMPMEAPTGICRGDRVRLTSSEQTLGVGEAMLGRVLDGAGRCIDGRGDFDVETRMPMASGPGMTLPALCRCSSGIDVKLPPEAPRNDSRGLRPRNDAEEARSAVQAGGA